MKRSALIMVLFAVLAGSGLLVSGCGDDDTTEPEVLSIADFAGDWTVTKFKMTHKTVPEMTIDFIQLGASITIDAQETGLFSGTAIMVDPITQESTTIPFSGNMTLDGQEAMTVSFTPEIPPFLTNFSGPFTYNGTSIEITDDSATFDFDGDQVEDPANAEMGMARI